MTNSGLFKDCLRKFYNYQAYVYLMISAFCLLEITTKTHTVNAGENQAQELSATIYLPETFGLPDYDDYTRRTIDQGSGEPNALFRFPGF